MPIRFPVVVEKIKYIVKYVMQSLPAVRIVYAYVEKAVKPVPSIIAYMYTAVDKILRATHVFFRLKGLVYAYIEKVVLPVPSIIAYMYTAVGKILRAPHVPLMEGLAFSLVLNVSKPMRNLISSISISVCRGSAVKTVKPYPSFSLVLAASKPTPTVIQSFQTSVEGRVES